MARAGCPAKSQGGGVIAKENVATENTLRTLTGLTGV